MNKTIVNKTILMSVIALAVSVAFVSAGIAQQKPAPAPAVPARASAAPATPAKQNWEKTTGVIEKVNEATQEVVVQTPKEKMTFSAGENTRITEGTAKTPLSGLKKGMGVTVEYKKEGNKLLAEWIDVHAAKAEAKPAAQAQAKETKEVKKEAKKESPSEKSMEKK